MDINTIRNKFLNIYGEKAEAIYFSPGRVNLIGEHTDYNGGYVLPCALSFGTFCLTRKNKDNTIRLTSLNMEFRTEQKLNDLTKPIGREWVNYPVGVFAQFIKRGLNPLCGLDILFYGDIPNGAGLSSSAALEMVTGVAVNDIFNFGVDRIDIIKMAQKAEHEFAGVNCGIMDQFASGMGEKDHAIFLNCDTLEYELVLLKLNEIKVVISNTNSPHKLDSGKYNTRVAECKAAVEAIKPYKDISTLSEISLNEFLQIAGLIEDETIRRRANHVVSEIKRTKDAVAELKDGNIYRFGELMNQSHTSLRDDYEVTGVQLDTMVEEARKIDGVIGSRMTGGGFGGCTVSLVKKEAVERFIAEVGLNYRQRTGLKPDFYVADIGDGSRKL